MEDRVPSKKRVKVYNYEIEGAPPQIREVDLDEDATAKQLLEKVAPTGDYRLYAPLKENIGELLDHLIDNNVELIYLVRNEDESIRERGHYEIRRIKE